MAIVADDKLSIHRVGKSQQAEKTARERIFFIIKNDIMVNKIVNKNFCFK